MFLKKHRHDFHAYIQVNDKEKNTIIMQKQNLFLKVEKNYKPKKDGRTSYQSFMDVLIEEKEDNKL